MDTNANSSAEPGRRTFLNALKILIIILLIAPAMTLIGVWSSLAIYYAGTDGQDFRWAYATGFAVIFFASLICLPRRIITSLVMLIACGAVFMWWFNMTPSHNRQWSPLTEVLSTATIEGDIVTVRDIRNFEYRSADDYDISYYDKTFDLSKIKTLDFIISYWGDNKRTAHSMLSFGFDDEEYLCVSVEARTQRDEKYTGLGGLFRKFDLIYVLGDEQDLIRSRTDFRGEHVYLYPTVSPPEDVRKLFVSILKRVNKIHAKPEFYNTITHNCTTTLAASGQEILPPNPFDYRLLLNGYADRMAFDNGWIDTKDPFDKTRTRHYVNRRLLDNPPPEIFSRRIRPHLPQPKLPEDPVPQTQPATAPAP